MKSEKDIREYMDALIKDRANRQEQIRDNVLDNPDWAEREIVRLTYEIQMLEWALGYR